MNISLTPPVLFSIAGFEVTNTFFVINIVYLLLIGIAIWVTTRVKHKPSGLQFWVEVAMEEGEKFVQSVVRDKTVTRKMFPFIMTLFLVFLLANFLSFIPGLNAITYNGVPIYRTATTDYSWIFSITIMSVILMQIISIATGGWWAYVKKFINLTGKWTEKPLNLFLGIMDIIAEFAKIISLSFRLFGNMFAGDVLAAVMLALLPFLAPVPFRLLGVLTALIQAGVFAILVLIFMNMAIVVKETKPQVE